MEKFLFSGYVTDDNNFYIADLSLKNGMQTIMHMHDYYEFFFVIKGQFYEICNGKELLIKRKQLHILRPCDSHQLKSGQTDEPNILRNIAIRSSVFEEVVSKIGFCSQQLGGYYKLDENTLEYFLNKSNLLHGPYPDGAMFDFIVQSLLEDVLITVAMHQKQTFLVPKWLESAYQAMELEENFSVGLTRLMDIAGKTPEHVTRAFKKYYNTTPARYINTIRLQNASLFLQTSQDKIIDIIYRCGYSNISYFNRLFKKHYGMTPYEYRRHKNMLFKSI